MNKKKRISISPKTKKYLQKEINSECPICKNQEIGHFEIHHIDEDPANNEFENLLMLCPICHSKITKQEITQQEVILIKNELPKIKTEIELANVFVDEKITHWKPDKKNQNIFFSEFNKNSKTSHLILNWSFINHLKKTVILKSVVYTAKSLPSGLNGPIMPTILTSLIKYKIPINFDEEKHRIDFSEQIQVPENQGFQFKMELFSKWEDKIFSLKGRFYLDFTFEFSNNQTINIPRLFFNCKSENEELKHYGLY